MNNNLPEEFFVPCTEEQANEVYELLEKNGYGTEGMSGPKDWVSYCEGVKVYKNRTFQSYDNNGNAKEITLDQLRKALTTTATSKTDKLLQARIKLGQLNNALFMGETYDENGNSNWAKVGGFISEIQDLLKSIEEPNFVEPPKNVTYTFRCVVTGAINADPTEVTTHRQLEKRIADSVNEALKDSHLTLESVSDYSYQPLGL